MIFFWGCQLQWPFLSNGNFMKPSTLMILSTLLSNEFHSSNPSPLWTLVCPFCGFLLNLSALWTWWTHPLSGQYARPLYGLDNISSFWDEVVHFMVFNKFVHFMDNKLVYFMDLIIFHPSRMKSSTLWTLINSSAFRDNKLVCF